MTDASLFCRQGMHTGSWPGSRPAAAHQLVAAHAALLHVPRCRSMSAQRLLCISHGQRAQYCKFGRSVVAVVQDGARVWLCCLCEWLLLGT